MQLSKTIYFKDYLAHSGVRSGLTIPFPDTERDLFQFVAPLSSYRLRELIGFHLFSELENAARRAASPVATFARGLLQTKTAKERSARPPSREAALQSTFRGGKGSPLHDWYPYLEGYSPDFVGTILDTYAPTGEVVLDPFCGSGTTVLVAAARGSRGLFSEVNPVCRFIIGAKAKALRLTEAARHEMALKIDEWATSLPSLLSLTTPDQGLAQSLVAAFSGRDSFEPKTLEQVLRLRTIVDEVMASDPELGTFLTVAALRSLVPGSLLVRRGDLRFRTRDELQRDPPRFMDSLLESCAVIASDLLDASVARGTVEYVAPNAKAVGEGIASQVDMVVTSPPYLNGTNYFRNTKLELWFLRHLSSRKSLREFRDAAITAGINDVTQGKVLGGSPFVSPPELNGVLKALQEDSYDQRIPLMVLSYFKEMSVVIDQLAIAAKPSAPVAIDLGDSCYGNVWVPTDRILASMMLQKGFEPIDHVVLRERQSRDGRKLSQTLQVFRAPDKSHSSSHKPAIVSRGSVPALWGTFRDTLPHQRGEMAKRNWGHSWHSLCSYQGKLKPSIAHTLVKALAPKTGGRILDPFSGVGTVPFEARLQGHTAFGFDISPAAVAISSAKLHSVAPHEVQRVVADLEDWVREHKSDVLDIDTIDAVRFNGPISSYFHHDTLAEIVAARSYFAERSPTENAAVALVMSSVLHILHGNRPYALSRRSHPITPFAPTGASEYRSLIDRLGQKLERSLRDLPSGPQGRAFYQDATGIWPDEASDLDAIVTSPPFFDSTRFYSANWMRLWFAGWDARDFASEPKAFVDERQKRDFSVYRALFSQSVERLKPGGYLAMHLGKSKKCDMAAELSKIGVEYLELVDSFTENVEHCESHGIRDKGAVTDHQYLLFQRA